MISRATWVLFLALFLLPHRSIAQTTNALLSLDGLSFVANALDQGEQIPLSAIPVRIDSQTGSTWDISIDPDDVHLPPVTLDNGDQVQWSLVRRATGTASFTNQIATITLSATFLAKSLNTTRQIEHDLVFTTGATEEQSSDLSVSREGFPLDRRTGYVQLVASASDPPGSEHAIPFFVVLSGRFTSGPPGFLSQ